MRLVRCVLLATIALVLPVGGLSSVARGSSGEVPVIEGTSVSNITETSVTLGAQVNPEGLTTTYQFWLECKIASSTETFCEPGSVPVLLVTRSIPSGVMTGQSVSWELNGLHVGYTYVFGVVASNAAGRTENRDNIAETAPPGACVKCANETPPYVPEVSQWSIEFNNAQGAQAVREYEAQLAHEQQAAEEALAKERAGWEAADREGEQRRIHEEEADRPVCVVPSLKGDSLPKARGVLLRAHCGLGAVSRLHGRRRGAASVVRQRPSPGTRLREGARVAVKLDVRAPVRHGRT